MQGILKPMNVLVLGLMLVSVAAAWADRDVPDDRGGGATERQATDDAREGYGPMMYHMHGMMHGRHEGRGPYGRMGEAADDDDMPWGGMMGPGMMHGMHGMMGHHGGGHGHRMLRKMERLTADLNLSEQQERDIRVRLRAHMKQAIQIQAELAAQRIDLQALLDAESVDMVKVKALLHDMAARRADLHFAHLSLLQEIKQQLTPEQQKKFNAKRGHGMRGYGRGDWRQHGRMHRYRHEEGYGRGMGRGMGMGRRGMHNPCAMREAPDKDR